MSSSRLLFAAPIVVGLLASIAAQAQAPAKPLEGGPAPQHEFYGDRYRRPARVQTAAPALIISRDGLISIQANVDSFGDNILGDAANEPSIAVNPVDPNNMVIGWRQFDTVTSNFRQAGWAYTFDAGNTWTFPGSIDAGVFRSDPVVDTDAGGVFYYNSLTADASLTEFLCHVFRSYDGGVTWAPGVFAQGGDKQWQVIDTTGGVGNGHIYAAWNPSYSAPNCNGMFTRSTNGGNSFESCTSIPNSPVWGTLAVGPDGELYIAGRASFSGHYVSKSMNARNAGIPVTWTSASVNLDGSTVYSTGPNPGGLLGQLSIDVDRSNGPRRGWVYVVSTIDRNSPSTDPADVMFSRSTNGGTTWSAPIRINDDNSSSNWQWFATMSVAPNGRIDVIWLDTRANPGTYLSELYYSYSEDGGTIWSPNIALSPAFNPALGYPQQNKIGDYYDMTSRNDAAHLAYAATFNGEQDVYYIKITRGLMLLPVAPLPTLLAPGQGAEINVRILPGSETYVDGTAYVHYRYNGGAYHSAPLTQVLGDLYKATLPPAYCGATPEFYFSAVGSENGIAYAPRAAPDEVYDFAVGAESVLYNFPMSTSPGWTVEGQWAFGQPTGAVAGSGRDPNSGYTGTNVYGYNLAGAYPNNMTQTYYLTTPPLSFAGSGAAKLRFRRWLGVESATYDHANIQASNNGTTWTTIWDHTGPSLNETSWSLQTYDISNVADNQPAVRIRWGMGPTDGSVTYQGWNIDDVELLGSSCTGQAYCAGDMDCNGVVDFFDIDPWVAALGSPAGVGWTNPNCPWLNADVNGDNAVDFFDIDAFVARLGQTCN